MGVDVGVGVGIGVDVGDSFGVGNGMGVGVCDGGIEVSFSIHPENNTADRTTIATTNPTTPIFPFILYHHCNIKLGLLNL